MPLQNQTLTFVGAGAMAEALIRGLLHQGRIAPGNITGTGRRPERLRELADRWGIGTSLSNAEAVVGRDIVVLSVKPQILDKVLAEVRPAISPATLVVSIAAGWRMDAIARGLGGHLRLCRAMPNTPAVVGAATTGYSVAEGLDAGDEAKAEALFSAFGITAKLDEALMDAVTGLSGSGPAYVFMIIEALSDAGVKVGLPRYQAQRMAAHTVLGAAKMLIETGEHPGVLKDRVTSPGGTAISGLHTLEEGGLRTTLINAVVTATARARALGRGDDGTS